MSFLRPLLAGAAGARGLPAAAQPAPARAAVAAAPPSPLSRRPLGRPTTPTRPPLLHPPTPPPAGAAGYNAVQNTQASDVAARILGLVAREGGAAAAAAGSQSASLQRQIDELQAALIRSLQGNRHITVVASGPGAGGWALLAVPAAAGAVGLVLVRLRGWRLSDFFYVTRSSFETLRGSVSDSFGRVQAQLREARSPRPLF